LYQLRRTATCAILFSYEEGWVTAEDIDFRRVLGKIVQQFGDDPHWENFFSQGISNHADENYPNAVLLYGKAQQCIQNDQNVREQPSWQERVRVIGELKQRAASGQPLEAPGFTSEYTGS
jgi:Ni,Fe-hydrogenase I large subunit